MRDHISYINTECSINSDFQGCYAPSGWSAVWTHLKVECLCPGSVFFTVKMRWPLINCCWSFTRSHFTKQYNMPWLQQRHQQSTRPDQWDTAVIWKQVNKQLYLSDQSKAAFKVTEEQFACMSWSVDNLWVLWPQKSVQLTHVNGCIRCWVRLLRWFWIRIYLTCKRTYAKTRTWSVSNQWVQIYKHPSIRQQTSISSELHSRRRQLMKWPFTS